jgi:capsular exopolysaccharide synthesis family protein
MSRNFELLHEAGKAQDMLRQTLDAVALSPPSLVSERPVVQIEGVARDQVTKLVQSLFLTTGPQRPRQVVFVGTESANGTSWMCARTAEVLAAQGLGSVCVVDCNMVTPTLHREFHVPNQYGIGDALLGNEPIRRYVQQLARTNLWLLSSGSVSDNSQAMLTEEAMRRRMLELRGEFDYVLLDVAPLTSGNHAALLGNWCDGVALVLRANASKRNSARKALRDFQAANTTILGVVLNQRTFPVPESIYSRL